MVQKEECLVFAVFVEGLGLLLQSSFPTPPTPGWQTPETALIDAHKLLRSIIILLMGGDVLSVQKAEESHFLDYGESKEESRPLWDWTH